LDRRVIAIIISGALLAVVVAVVLISRAGEDGDSGPDEVSTDLTAKPEPAIPEGEPPTELVTEDVVEGEGAELKDGDTAEVDYVGVLYDGGTEFDSSWEGEPIEFELGAGSVIPGWEEGLVGMREGGRRQLIIPSDLAYGPSGQPPTIPPDAALVFVVDLLSIS
jgi:peptidylprolyl isomerase